MNAKQELAKRILNMVGDEIRPDGQRIFDMLGDYNISYGNPESEMNFQRQIESFIFAKKAEGILENTVYNYRLYLNMFSVYIDKETINITTGDIRDFIGYLTEIRGNKLNSAQSVLNILRSFFGWLYVEELIPRDPTLRIKSFKIDRKNSRHPLSAEQMELIRNACQTYREKAMVEFMYSSGCRLSEMTQIDLDTVDFNRRTVSVIGKGNKRRTLYFSVKANLMIRFYLAERPGGTALFSGWRKPYRRLGSGAVEKIVAALGKRAGIVRPVHPHLFRHTLATDLLNSGMDITIIQQILGHASVGTTQIYAEMAEGSVEREYHKYVA